MIHYTLERFVTTIIVRFAELSLTEGAIW